MTEAQEQKRKELREYFDARGGRNANIRDVRWNEVFDLYYEVTKNKLSKGCGGCYTKGYNFLIQ